MHTPAQLNAALEGRYSIERQVGAGGMATVFLARDLKHHRQVALKVLDPELGAVLGYERFMAEIEVTANLHHPNLLPLFDSGEAGGLLFYAMPYVEGETLRARLERERQLPVDEAVRIAVAIAGALDYAHRHQVIHRDLKPENILMHEGQPLVMDFGIALAVSRAGGARITQTGLSLGTPQYMSPEQATGDHALDGRTDIYSLGAVLYETLVGDPPHTGSTVQAVIAKVITERPGSVRATRPSVPEHVEAALMTALAKLPADRFASAADLAAALSGQRPVTMPTATRAFTAATLDPAPARRMARRERAAWGLAAAGLALAAWGARPRPAPPAAPLGRFTVEVGGGAPTLASNVNSPRLALSPDGSLLAFTSRDPATRALQTFVRRADDPVPRRVPGADSGTVLAFSPDGGSLLLSMEQGRRLARVPVSGGTAATLVSGDDGARMTNAHWGDGDQVLLTGGGELWLTTGDGLEPRRIIAPDTATGILSVSHPHVLPGGRYAIVTLFRTRTIVTLDSARLAVVRLADGEVTELGATGIRAQYAESGHLVFVREDGIVYAAPFSLARRRLTGAPVRILDNLASPSAANFDLSISRNGWMAYATGQSQVQRALMAVDRAGRERLVRNDLRAYSDVRLSPDGRRIAMRIGGDRFNTGDIWVHEMAGGALSRLTRDEVSYRPQWSRDGARVFFMNGQASGTRILSRAWDGSGAESTMVDRGSLAEVVPGPAGGLSAVRTLFGPRDIWLAPTETLTAMRPFVTGPADEVNPQISPDGRWLAYTSNETGESEVYVRPIPGPGQRLTISVGGGMQPRWSHDGRTVFYRGPRRLMAAHLTPGAERSVARRDSLFVDTYGRNTDYETWDVFPDDRTFLMLKGPPPVPVPITVLVNWQALLGRGGDGVVDR